MLGLKIAGTIVGIWIGINGAKLAIAWLREGINSMKPENIKKRKEKMPWE